MLMFTWSSCDYASCQQSDLLFGLSCLCVYVDGCDGYGIEEADLDLVDLCVSVLVTSYGLGEEFGYGICASYAGVLFICGESGGSEGS